MTKLILLQKNKKNISSFYTARKGRYQNCAEGFYSIGQIRLHWFGVICKFRWYTLEKFFKKAGDMVADLWVRQVSRSVGGSLAESFRLSGEVKLYIKIM